MHVDSPLPILLVRTEKIVSFIIEKIMYIRKKTVRHCQIVYINPTMQFKHFSVRKPPSERMEHYIFQFKWLQLIS